MEQQGNFFALDIDGTLTTKADRIDPELLEYLQGLTEWHLVFLTGRTLSFVWPLLQPMKRSFDLAVQNGASLLRFPEKKRLSAHYLDVAIVPNLAQVCQKHQVTLLIESGEMNGDICYYNDVPSQDREYLEYRKSISRATWRQVSDWQELPISHFAAGKFFAHRALSLHIPGTQVRVIRDLFRPGTFLGHITHEKASKDEALKAVAKKWKKLIAVGDDFNDLEMLKMADIAIAIEGAPQEVLACADIVTSHENLLETFKRVVR